MVEMLAKIKFNLYIAGQNFNSKIVREKLRLKIAAESAAKSNFMMVRSTFA